MEGRLMLLAQIATEIPRDEIPRDEIPGGVAVTISLIALLIWAGARRKR